MKVFTTSSNDDAHVNFTRWCEAHPQGYVINCKTQTDMMLHRVTCGHFEFGDAATVDLALAQKVCSENRAELEQWAFINSDSPLRVCHDCLRAPLTLFSWGYYGWGNAVDQLARAINKVEAARGYGKPLLVDIRWSHSVRAKGFNGSAAAQTLGSKQYMPMRGLGNKAIKRRTGPAIQIADPSKAESLLDEAMSLANDTRRAIFFCSCAYPVSPGTTCHRTEVADLLLDAAARRNIPLQVVEWPGDSPKIINKSVPGEEFKKLRASWKSLPLGERLPSAEYLGLPWGSVVVVEHAGDSLAFVTGPAKFSGQWYLPLIRDLSNPRAPLCEVKKAGWDWRHEHGLEPKAIMP